MLGDWDAATVAQLVSASSDLALVLDKKGVIRDLAIEDDSLLDYGCGEWVGRPWLDVVTVESRPKVEEILKAAPLEGPRRWRQINHPAAKGDDLPVRYTTVKLGSEGRVLAVGRDLRPISVLQQRLVTAQARMEQEYERLRLAETRYQTLFQLSGEAVVVLDAASMKIVEANPAASRFLANGSSRVVGKTFLDLLDSSSLEAAQTLFAELRVSPRARDAAIRLNTGDARFSLSASMFRQDNAAHFLVRLSPASVNGYHFHEPGIASRLMDVIAGMPDGFVVIDENRSILMANASFVELAQLASEDQARGQKIERWLGRVDVDVEVLISNLREHGFARRFPTMVRGEFGLREDVEVSGVAALQGNPPCYGLILRKPAPAIVQTVMQRPAAPRSFEQLKELVGRVPLRDLVRETTDIIEQMCIEAALELTGDNRASAAEMLGLSRQSLYVKLRRHGLGELDGQERQ